MHMLEIIQRPIIRWWKATSGAPQAAMPACHSPGDGDVARGQTDPPNLRRAHIE